MTSPRLLADEIHLETSAVHQATAKAEAKLGELKGFIHTIPNKEILLNTLPLQEARASSEIENIVTTADELFRSNVDSSVNGHTKEVRAYADALLSGYEQIKRSSVLRAQDVERVHAQLMGNTAGFRTQAGTMLKDGAGRVVYAPPQDAAAVASLIANLMDFINDDAMSPLNPLVKMAVIHHQFESIHPFYDGNGRSGRIINVLYLILKEKLDLPVLYLSRYIIDNKNEYYRLLQSVRDSGEWEAWLLFILDGVYQTAGQTIDLVRAITRLMRDYKQRIRASDPRMYSQDLINVLFKHPYTRIEYVAAELNCHRQTATRYLARLVAGGYMVKARVGRSNYYVNPVLVECLISVHDK